MAAELVEALRPTDIHGWMTDDELAWLTAQARQASFTAEVGIWKGRTTAALLNGGTQVWAADLWTPYTTFDVNDEVAKELQARGGDAVMQDFLATFAPFLGSRLRVFRADSVTLANAMRDFGLLFDFVFIDGDHSAEMVHRDIRALWSVLKVGGTMAGHDFHLPGVQHAVAACFSAVPMRPCGVIWEVRK